MQRAAASSNRSPSTTANTPIRDTNHSPFTKLQRLTGSGPSTPGTPTSAQAESPDIPTASTALGAEEGSRSDIRVRSIPTGGETEWILNLPRANGSTGRSLPGQGALADNVQQDEDVEDEIWGDHSVGRRSYGAFKRKKAQAGTTTTTAAKLGDDAEEPSEADCSDSDLGAHQHSTKRPKQQDPNYEDWEQKRWQAMDRMNLKRQNHISGFSPKRALDKGTSKVKKRSRHSSKSQ